MSNEQTSLTYLQSTWGLSPATVTPGCFASVMATGIMSIGAHLKGLTALSTVLFWLAVVLYVFLVVLVIWRACSHTAELRGDLHNPSKAFGYFTFVAATNVLATALEGQSHFRVALAFFGLGLLAWLILGYLIPFSAILGSTTSPILTQVNGTWFVCVVAAQSVAVAASGLMAELPAPAADANFGAVLAVIAVIAWSVGVGMYLACAVFVGVRALLHRIGPEDLDAPYWVMMGALASQSSRDRRSSKEAPPRSSRPPPSSSRAPRRSCGRSRPGSSLRSSSPVYGGTCATAFPWDTRPGCGAWSFRSECTPWRAQAWGRSTRCRSSRGSALNGTGSD